MVDGYSALYPGVHPIPPSELLHRGDSASLLAAHLAAAVLTSILDVYEVLEFKTKQKTQGIQL